MNNQRHFAKVRGEEVVVVGYKRSMNACMVCRLNSLPQDESTQLRRIASSMNAQEQDYLVQTLQVEKHKSGQDWFTYLASRLHRSDGSVVSMPLKEIEDMHPGQKAFFKGYGKSVTEAEKAKGDVDVEEDSKDVPQAYIEDEKERQRAASMAVDPGQQAMMQLMQQLVEGQTQLTNSINELSTKLQDDSKSENTTKKSTAKASTTRRRAPSKKTTTKKENEEGISA